jgi:hypothetical protein
MFARIKPLGWGYGEILYSDEITALDAEMPYALDSRGGTYNIANALVLALAGTGYVQIDRLFRANGQSAWPGVIVTTENAFDEGYCPHVIDVFVIDSISDYGYFVLRRQGAIENNLQIVSTRNTVAHSRILYDETTSTQLAVLLSNEWVLTAYSGGAFHVVLKGTNGSI